MKRLAAAGGTLAIFILTGGAWIGLTRWIPGNIPYLREAVIIGMGLVFAAVFVWLLTTRVKRLFIYPSEWYREMSFALVNLGLLLAAFAYVYHTVGIIDTTGSGPARVTHDYPTCLYFSTITFTTVGYGDYRPAGLVARTMAGLQGLLGYIVLALLASTVTTVIQNRAQQHKEEKED